MWFIKSLIRMLSNERGEVNVAEERDAEEVAREAYAEMDAVKDGQPTDKKDPTPKKDESDKTETDDQADEQAEGEKKDGESAEGKEEEADEKSEGEEGENKSDESTDDKSKESEPDLDKKITEYAQKHGMTYAEAKDDIEKTDEILKQFKNDPAEMAKAMRHKDREYQKLRTEKEKADAKKQPAFRRLSDEHFRNWARKAVAEKPEYVEKYRAAFPAKSESMSDEAIIEEVVEQELGIYKRKADEKEGEIKTTATKKREELIASIPEADRRFIPDVKAILLETSDSDVLEADDLVKDALLHAKGKSYDADIKAAEDRGFKRGQEQPKIVGVKSGGTGSQKSKDSKSAGASLTSKQKEYANNMFGADYEDEGKRFQMFQETFSDELKKNPKFDPYAVE